MNSTVTSASTVPSSSGSSVTGIAHPTMVALCPSGTRQTGFVCVETAENAHQRTFRRDFSDARLVVWLVSHCGGGFGSCAIAWAPPRASAQDMVHGVPVTPPALL